MNTSSINDNTRIAAAAEVEVIKLGQPDALGHRSGLAGWDGNGDGIAKLPFNGVDGLCEGSQLPSPRPDHAPLLCPRLLVPR